MRYIRVFLAGSKKLTSYRERLILWANTKNYAFRKAEENLQINIYSFKEVGDDQDVYNRVITDDTDIIIFLVEGFLGERTKEELMIAKESLNRSNHPEIWVFTNNVEPTAMHYLEGALGRKYTVDFDSSSDLVNKVNVRIDDYIKRFNLHEPEEPEVSKSQTPSALTSRGNFYKNAAIALLILLVGLGAGLLLRATVFSKPKLLIAGGGSVANYIEERVNEEDFLENYPGGYYVHVPTKAAWTMLIDEVVSKQTKRRYYPICISATAANDSDFTKPKMTKSAYTQKGIVVACRLGDDPLYLYIQREHYNSIANQKDSTISRDALKNLIFSKKCQIYTTLEGSGTWQTYCDSLDISSETLKKHVRDCFSEDNYNIPSLKDDPAPIVLFGSQYYKMKRATELLPAKVEPEILKPLYVYIMAYKKNADNDILEEYCYWIPDETRDFLRTINYHDLDNYIARDGTIKIVNESLVIYPLDSLALQYANPKLAAQSK